MDIHPFAIFIGVVIVPPMIHHVADQCVYRNHGGVYREFVWPKEMRRRKSPE
ncbi:MAG: hypothetical protein M2R45_04576 [Verrucomicrobia subdivision 3 bacterium]|nr:hypothetical protein [Limisphaerales bacterium]MCS1417351.1 hypothetical protein [Limisphaerales bacterium]